MKNIKKQITKFKQIRVSLLIRKVERKAVSIGIPSAVAGFREITNGR